MTRILHLSDLHFGYHRRDLVEPLLERVNDLAADLVVLTGDVTHRARSGQFAEAREFLDRVKAPLLAVPGNHDVPLYNVPLRLISPYGAYDRAMGTDHAPARSVGRVDIQGMNSVDHLAWQRGKLRKDQIERAAGSVTPGKTTIAALHHPLQHLPRVDKTLAENAPLALRRLEAAGVRIVLTGHLHQWAAGSLLEMGHPHILQVQGGTALCDRPTDRQNEFALLDIGETLRIERHIAPIDAGSFQPPQLLHFTYGPSGWVADGGVDTAGPMLQ